MFALNQHVLATLVKNWQCLVEQRGMFGRPSDSISRGLETRPAINLLQTISLHCSFIMGIGQQLQRLNLFSKWNPHCSESPWHFLPMMQTLYYAIDTWRIVWSLTVPSWHYNGGQPPKTKKFWRKSANSPSSLLFLQHSVLNPKLVFFFFRKLTKHVLPLFFYAFGEMISFLASTYVFCQTETAPNGVLWKVWMWNNMSAAQLVTRINIEHRTEMQTFH